MGRDAGVFRLEPDGLDGSFVMVGEQASAARAIAMDEPFLELVRYAPLAVSVPYRLQSAFDESPDIAFERLFLILTALLVPDPVADLLSILWQATQQYRSQILTAVRSF